MSAKIKVLQLIDTLSTGGAERMAVNIANSLPQESFESYLCTSRYGGTMQQELKPHVEYLNLKRQSRWDVSAIFRLRSFIKERGINIIHAHSTSFFIARIATLGMNVKLFWHVHNGKQPETERFPWLYRLFAFHIAGVVVVNHKLKAWVINKLRVREEKVFYLPNFVTPPEAIAQSESHDYPGSSENRIVSVANLRPVKDQMMLVQAIARVVKEHDVHLLLVGSYSDAAYVKSLQEEINQLGLTDKVHLLGERNDVYPILRASTIAVVSSVSEGLPLALLEYGSVGLPTISTAVGECPGVLLNGEAGILVEPSNPAMMAEAIIRLLENKASRLKLGQDFKHHIAKTYGKESIIQQLSHIYCAAIEKPIERVLSV